MGYIVLRKVKTNLNKSQLTVPTENYELSFPVDSAVDEFGNGEHAVVTKEGTIVGKLYLHTSNPKPYSGPKR